MTQLIVALDAPLDRAVDLYRALKGIVPVFKVGIPTLLEPAGRQFARDIAVENRLFLDAKIYDTRDTVRRTMEAVGRLGAHLVTVHEDCVEHTIDCRGAAAVLAVRGLTDHPGGRHAAIALADGIVCSVSHARFMRSMTDKLLVCPGIRPEGASPDNHAVTYTPAEAARAEADYIVVGRPIWASDDPVGAAQRIIEEIGT